MRPPSPDIPGRRLSSTGLRPPLFPDPVAAVRWHGAVQAQDYPAAKWALGLRAGRSAPDEVDALLNQGRLLRTHVLRPTWHLVAPEDIRWLIRLTGPRVLAINSHYHRRLGLEPPLLERAMKLVAAALAAGNRLTRQELAEVLRRDGIEAGGVRLAYLVGFAELEAVICSGGLRGKQFTYALLDEVAPPGLALEGETAIAELARRYFQGHGPAMAEDFAWWSGLTLNQSRAAVEMLQPALTGETVEDRTYWSFGGDARRPSGTPEVMLLPNFDEYTVAFRDRRHHYDPARIAHYPTGAALLANTVLIDGGVVGTWRRAVKNGKVVVTPNLLTPLRPAETAGLELAIAAYGRFLGVPAVMAPG